jgi:hypothetical protein
MTFNIFYYLKNIEDMIWTIEVLLLTKGLNQESCTHSMSWLLLSHFNSLYGPTNVRNKSKFLSPIDPF